MKQRDLERKLAAVKTLAEGKTLYRKLGSMLQHSAGEQRAQGITSAWRQAAKDARRALEKQFGPEVRGVDVLERVGQKVGSVVPAAYTYRKHVTINKPEPGRRGVLVLQLDPMTGEVLRVFNPAAGDMPKIQALLGPYETKAKPR
jgi:hypothetical protein